MKKPKLKRNFFTYVTVFLFTLVGLLSLLSACTFLIVGISYNHNPEDAVSRATNWEIYYVSREFAESLKLQAGDSISAVNGNFELSFQEVYNQLLQARNTQVTLTILRNKKVFNHEVVIPGDLMPTEEESRILFRSKIELDENKKPRMLPVKSILVIFFVYIGFSLINLFLAWNIFKQKKFGYNLGAIVIFLFLVLSITSLGAYSLLYSFTLYLSLGLSYKKTFLSHHKSTFLASV